MLRRLGPQPFPLPILFGDSVVVIYLTEWEITRGQADSYDAYAALVAYAASLDPTEDWSSRPGENASITTAVWTAPDGFLGYYANDTQATAALPEVTESSLTHEEITDDDMAGDRQYIGAGDTLPDADSYGSGDVFVREVAEGAPTIYLVSVIGGQPNFWSEAGVTGDEPQIEILLSPAGKSSTEWLGHLTEAEVIAALEANYDDTQTYYFLNNISGSDPIHKVTAFTAGSGSNTVTYLNTTDNTFYQTTDGGTTWTAAEITDAALIDNADAIFLTQQTSVAARAHLDTEGNYDSTKTYYFYNGTAIREVTAFTPSVEAVAVLSNYRLDANAPDALSFNTETGVISGNLPLTSRIGRVYFTVDVDVENRKVRIPVRLTPFATVALTWTVQAGVDEGFTVSGYGIRAINDEDLQYQKLWADEHASAPDVVKDAIYYNTADDAFYVEVAFGTSQERWTAISSPTAFDVDGNVTWLGPLDAAGVRQYFIDNTYDSTQPYYYYDTALGEVRKIQDYTDLGATYGAPLSNLQLSPLGDLFTISDLVVDFSAPLDHTDSDETQTLTGTVRAAGEEVPITLTVTIQPGPQLPSPEPDLTPGNTYIVVTWAAVFGATGYAVFYRTANPGEWIQVQRADPTTLTETIGPLSNDVEYDVNVVALSPKYRDSSPQAVQATPTSPPAYFTWLTGTSAFMVNGKTWVLSSTTQTQTWIIGNETFMLDGEAWLIN